MKQWENEESIDHYMRQKTIEKYGDKPQFFFKKNTFNGASPEKKGTKTVWQKT